MGSFLSSERNQYRERPAGAGLPTRADVAPVRVLQNHDFPPSALVANEHLLRIRGGFGLGTSGDGNILENRELVKNLEAALKIISERLYQESTHFLLEMLQNADDNTYGECSPTLNIEYKGQYVLISSNEIGFSVQNVEAICKIGDSNKYGSGDTIGEKGIGFKSVFKIADVVWIKSGHYSFSFDKSRTLGMVAPMPAKLPAAQSAQESGTVICLLLRDQFKDDLIRDIKSFDPRHLIFLRKLRRLNLSVEERYCKPWSTSIVRRDETGPSETQRYVELHRDSSHLRYIIIRHTAQNIHPDPSRAGRSGSEVLLGFSISNEETPVLTSQSVYSFLPIRDYGFKFLIQADFLLNASRQDIDVSCAWNLSILHALPSAILEAVERLNQGPMQYSWPRFFQARTPLADFFANLEETAPKLLSTRPILRSCMESANSWFKPTELCQVASRFLDAQGEPLLICNSLSQKYLSPKYSADDCDALRHLGVRMQPDLEFLADLEIFLEKHHRDFRQRPADWHSKLSRALTHIFRQQMLPEGYRERIVRMKLIPLRNGEWVASTLGTLFFSGGDVSRIPAGIEIFEVDPTLERDGARGDLLHALGVQPFSVELVSKVIARTHSSPPSKVANFSPADLASHALFLYHSGLDPSKMPRLRFAAADGTIGFGNQYYLRHAGKFAASDWPHQFVDTVRFLHDEYLPRSVQDPNSLPKWIGWLERSQGVHIFPPLVSSVTSDTDSLSKDFQTLLRTCPSNRILELLKHRWQHYAESIKEKASPAGKTSMSFKEKLMAELGSIQVDCQGGGKVALRDTTLALEGIPPPFSSYLNVLNVLDVPNPGDAGWAFLKDFGVSSSLTTSGLIRLLQVLRRAKISTKDVSPVYVKLQCCESSEYGNIRQAFISEPLIFVPSASSDIEGRWFKKDACVWGSHPALQKMKCLEPYYPELRNFFLNTLQVQEVGLVAIVSETANICPSDNLPYIAALLIALSKSLTEKSDNQKKAQLHRLMEKKIFPVKRRPPWDTFDYLRTYDETERWLIADRPNLRHAFEGQVDLLAFSCKEIQDMSGLLSDLGLACRLMSKVATRLLRVRGVRPHDGRSQSLRSKAHLVASLVDPGRFKERCDVFNALKLVDVYEAEEVVVQWSIMTADGSNILSQDNLGCVKVVREESLLSIYMTKELLDQPRSPRELIKQLSEQCGIESDRHLLLLDILDTVDVALLSERLGENGVIVDTFGAELKLVATRAGEASGHRPLPANSQQRAADRAKNDKLLSLVQGIDNTRSVDLLLRRDWSTEEMGNLLSTASALDDLNPAHFIPLNTVKYRWERGMRLPHERTTWSHLSLGTSAFDWNKRYPSTDHIFEAIYIPRHSTFHIYSRNINNVTEETAFLGEFAFSKQLQNLLGVTYSPERSWTSVLRRKAGYSPYEGGDKQTSAFTIADDSGEFSVLLRRFGHRSPRKGGIFNIDVVTTEGSLDESDFYLTAEQFRKAQLHSRQADSSTPDRWILVRVFDVYKSRGIALFPDPWKMVAEGELLVSNSSHYRMEFANKASRYITLQGDMGDVTLDEGVYKIPNNLLSLLGGWKPRPGTPVSTERYTYQPLREFYNIRLLKLCPGSGDSRLEGEIWETSLQEAENKFKALSHRWPKSRATYTALSTTQGQVPLTPSLHIALRQLRDANCELVLWVDAICINQEDKDERKTQVHLMNKIFRSAEKVVAWLGDEADDSGRAVEALIQIRTLALSLPTWPSKLPNAPESWHERSCPGDHDEVWENIEALFGRDWFERVWVLQEIVFASRITVYCGQCMIDWDILFQALKICVKKRPQLLEDRPRQPGRPSALAAYTLGITREAYLSSPKHPFGLLDLFELFSYTQATDPRDKLFALRLLASDVDDPAFDPDYSIPFEGVAQRYANAFVARGDALELLYRAGISKSFEFPSWIPNWTGDEYPRTISTWYSSVGRFSAAGDTLAEAHISDLDQKVLVVSGVFVDSIASVGTVTRLDSDAVKYVNALQQAVANLTSYPGKESVDDLVDELKARLPIGDASRPHLDALTGAASAHSMLTNFASPPERAGSDTDHHSKEEQSKFGSGAVNCMTLENFVKCFKQGWEHRQDMWAYWWTASSFSQRLSGAKFCTTKRGYAGLVPQHAAPGDAVVIIHGAAVPFLIRKRKGENDAGGQKTLVGECYIHGIMHGESLKFEGMRKEYIHLV